MADLKYKEKSIDVSGTKLPYQRAIVPSDLEEFGPTQLDQATKSVNEQIDEYCALVAEVSYIGPNEKQKLFKRLIDVREDIIKSKNNPDPLDRELVLSKANFEIHRVHADIADEQEQELTRKKSELSKDVKILGVVYFIIIIVLIVLGFVLGWETDERMIGMPGIGIPFSVLLWSVMGSLAAILYRFYKLQIRELEQAELEVRWLIARPVLGIVMGMVTYLIITAGLFVFGSATSVDYQSTAPQFLWLVAFLAGFSDRFWEGLIDKLIGGTP